MGSMLLINGSDKREVARHQCEMHPPFSRSCNFVHSTEPRWPLCFSAPQQRQIAPANHPNIFDPQNVPLPDGHNTTRCNVLSTSASIDQHFYRDGSLPTP